MKRISIILLVLSMSLELLAARVTVDMRLDSVSMLIGHQNRCYLEVSAPNDAEVNIPVYLQDTIVKGLMILQRYPMDSIDIDNGRKRMSMEYLITSFDAGVYFIPPVTVEVDGEAYESNYLTLKVNTFEVDTASMQMFDIKPVEKAPFVLTDYTQLPAMIFGVIGLITLIISLIVTFSKPKEMVVLAAPEILLPPHVVALSALDAIKEEKLWQHGRYKEFYTQLTDVLRAYMSRRFDFPAMEMTTWEILSILKKTPEASELYLSMQQLLELSDFVKFAKMNPLPEENDRSIRVAYEFVELTREQEEAESPEVSENPVADEQNQEAMNNTLNEQQS